MLGATKPAEDLGDKGSAIYCGQHHLIEAETPDKHALTGAQLPSLIALPVVEAASEQPQGEIIPREVLHLSRLVETILPKLETAGLARELRESLQALLVNDRRELPMFADFLKASKSYSFLESVNLKQLTMLEQVGHNLGVLYFFKRLCVEDVILAGKILERMQQGNQGEDSALSEKIGLFYTRTLLAAQSPVASSLLREFNKQNSILETQFLKGCLKEWLYPDQKSDSRSFSGLSFFSSEKQGPFAKLSDQKIIPAQQVILHASVEGAARLKLEERKLAEQRESAALVQAKALAAESSSLAEAHAKIRVLETKIAQLQAAIEQRSKIEQEGTEVQGSGFLEPFADMKASSADLMIRTQPKKGTPYPEKKPIVILSSHGGRGADKTKLLSAENSPSNNEISLDSMPRPNKVIPGRIRKEDVFALDYKVGKEFASRQSGRDLNDALANPEAYSKALSAWRARVEHVLNKKFTLILDSEVSRELFETRGVPTEWFSSAQGAVVLTIPPQGIKYVEKGWGASYFELENYNMLQEGDYGRRAGLFYALQQQLEVYNGEYVKRVQK